MRISTFQFTFLTQISVNIFIIMEEERVGERSDTELDNESDVEMTGIEDDSEVSRLNLEMR